MTIRALIQLLMAVVVVAGPFIAAHAEDTPSNMGTGVPDSLVVARAAIAAKDWPRALAELHTVLKTEPRNADVHNLLGYSHRKQAQPNLVKAFEHYKLALQIDPGHKGAHEYIGEAYLMQQRPAEAEKHLAQLAVLCGNQTCEEYVDLSEAIAAFKRTSPR